MIAKLLIAISIAFISNPTMANTTLTPETQPDLLCAITLAPLDRCPTGNSN
jgi:hypothetical protein